jgi:heterodisulfide reductase subunit A
MGTIMKLDTRMGSFLKPADEHLEANRGSREGLFYAGTCCGPMTITETLADARAAALAVEQYLKKK